MHLGQPESCRGAQDSSSTLHQCHSKPDNHTGPISFLQGLLPGLPAETPPERKQVSFYLAVTDKEIQTCVLLQPLLIMLLCFPYRSNSWNRNVNQHILTCNYSMNFSETPARLLPGREIHQQVKAHKPEEEGQHSWQPISSVPLAAGPGRLL